MKSRRQEIAEAKLHVLNLAARARDNKRRLAAERLLDSYEGASGGMIPTWYLADMGQLLRMHRDTVLRQFKPCLHKLGGRWAISRAELLAALEDAA